MSLKFNQFEHQRSKMLSSYGGIGSIVDHGNFSVLIHTRNLDPQKSQIIHDERLIEHLRCSFRQLKGIIAVPEFDSEESPNRQQKIKATYFPEWMYCPTCRSFKPWSEWKKSIKCTKCSRTLEQIPYILTCSNGHIHDLPWKHWNKLESLKTGKQEKGKDIYSLEPDDKLLCCNNQNLELHTWDINDINKTSIKCTSCKKEKNLSSLWNILFACNGSKPWIDRDEKENCDKYLKVQIKSSNSIYYSNTFSSIYFPEDNGFLPEDVRKRIDKLLQLDRSEEKIIQEIKDEYAQELKGLESERLIKAYLNPSKETKAQYRNKEYNFFMNNTSSKNDLSFTSINYPNEAKEYIEKIVRINRLKQIITQISFTRQQPIDLDYPKNIVKEQYTFSEDKQTKYLMGIEAYGEGIFIALNEDKVKKWEQNNEVVEATKTVGHRISQSQNSYIQAKEHLVEKLLPRFVLVHTFSHLLIKELEYVCGYPASSIQERLYVDENMSGVLLQVVEGSEGSLGGLISLCNENDPNEFWKLVKNALHRKKEGLCSSDPICYESEQGVEGLNFAACYSCTLLPETSCEEFNLFLNRKLVIDDEIGFFKFQKSE